ncbi:uncharacterized protein LTHEOB_12698 [Lasiodiplodia theobromae]|uniref:uncharacterized protein n=1 Tax=Lasiodiplodia theobromae TaxID=45133 RepID=UPI0015C36CB2|nr:uncharacterized protein LTHEOB_12698 [Lasiodiplodia theobromae]KAF4535217.1 hypothetical protein LTHEOB_12698 [Lasiodiplodia theobromae]
MPLGLGEQPAVTPGSPDILCIAIRNLSMYLRDLRLEDLRVSPELFWPTVEQQRQQPLWPHLETLYLNFEPVDSYGRFYADPIPEELAYNATQNTPVESIKRALPRR